MSTKERLDAFLAYLKLSQDVFEKKVGLSTGYVNNVGDSPRRSSLKKITDKYPELNTAWLLTGEGSMLKSNNISADKIDKLQNEGNYILVPVIHIDSVGGMHSPNAITDEKQYIESYIPFTDARKSDVCIVESGDSMQPTIPSGSILLLREVPNWKDYFGFGNIYVIELNDGRRITKEITRYDENPKDYVWCKSHNPEVPDEELPKSMIVSVWKVIKILINKGF
jgi:phage repressor protein C with HTH and peptisase S24 domain